MDLIHGMPTQVGRVEGRQFNSQESWWCRYQQDQAGFYARVNDKDRNAHLALSEFGRIASYTMYAPLAFPAPRKRVREAL